MATPAKAGAGGRLNEGQSMTDRIAIFGYGSVGRPTTARLLAEGRAVIVAQRRAPPDLPKGATFAPCDVLDRDAVVKP
jgi:nucleoside-diphosphate-sugar epimerase